MPEDETSMEIYKHYKVFREGVDRFKTFLTRHKFVKREDDEETEEEPEPPQPDVQPSTTPLTTLKRKGSVSAPRKAAPKRRLTADMVSDDPDEETTQF